MRLVILLLLNVCGACRTVIAAEYDYDVVIFGATPAGVAAAVAAAREGVSVALVEPMNIVGGIMSSGLSFSDSDQTDRRTMRGLFEEVHLRIEQHYKDKGVVLPYSVAVKDQAHWSYEPHVAEKVFHDMLGEANVRIFLNERLVSVTKNSTRIQFLQTEVNRFSARIFVDSTSEGDLLAASGVSWTVGREGRQQYNESFAGKQLPKKPVNVSPYDAQGALLPLMTGRALGDLEAGDKGIMTYSFRLCLTQNEANKVPFRKPVSYDPARYELVRRFVKAYPPKHPLFGFLPLPGGKIDGNNSIGGQISIGLVGENWSWPEASYQERDRLWQAHKDYTEGLIWFMMHDESMPEAVRIEMQRWGLAKDEFTRWDNWPPVLYVREARRMLGEYVITQHDILSDTAKPDSIGIGSFPIDSHDVQRVATADGGFLNEGMIFPRHAPGQKFGQPHQLPYRAITPRREECQNLLVPVALSCTHVAFSSIRVEPTWMVLGQSAGVAAALAAKTQQAVQDIPYPQLRTRLVAQNQVLDFPPPPMTSVPPKGTVP